MEGESMQAPLRIGTVAKEAGVKVDTVRYYERRGLLSPVARRSSGYREFDSTAVRRIRFIRSAQDLGFTLEEIRELLGMRRDENATCEDVRVRAQAKVAAIDEKIRLLTRMRESLERISAECSGEGPAEDCPILEYLDR